jgi:Fe-Mn family superoxide dismutase
VHIIRAAKHNGNQGLFNNAAQAWNHAFYWTCMKQGGGGAPTGRIGDAINASFGSYDKFRSEFETAATTAFGSAWAWLVWQDGTIKITKTSNADTPIADPQTKPLLTIVSVHRLMFLFRAELNISFL